MFTNNNDTALGYMMGQNNNEFGGGWIWMLVIIALIFGYGGNGLFGNGSATASGITDGYVLTSDFANIERKLDTVTNGISSLGYESARMMNGLENVVQNGDAAIGAQINQLASANQYAFADVNYRLAEQACLTRQTINDAARGIIDNQNQNYRAMMDYFTQDKIATLTAENQNLKNIASQQAQSDYLVARLAPPQPVPAYVVQNPNAAYGCPNCGC